jgi:hypothetical protein
MRITAVEFLGVPQSGEMAFVIVEQFVALGHGRSPSPGSMRA